MNQLIANVDAFSVWNFGLKILETINETVNADFLVNNFELRRL